MFVQWLDTFRVAANGDDKTRRILERYNDMIAAKRAKERIKEMLREAFVSMLRFLDCRCLIQVQAWEEKLKNRPILTGGLFRPTIDNGPLPRMKPQPEKISGMITYRRKARLRRFAKYELQGEWRSDVAHELAFENNLARTSSKPFAQHYQTKEWGSSNFFQSFM